jgi:dUTP pyrophosphatase
MLKDIQIEVAYTRDFKPELPLYATSGSAAVDLRAAVPEPTLIGPLEELTIPTGISIHIKDPNVVGLIVPRSGLASVEGISLINTVGVIDSDYTGEILLKVWRNKREGVFQIIPDMRIAQLLFMPITRAWFNLVDDHETTGRASGGFGHTGVA